ncbi:MAG: hypothetical protein BRD41_05205 [Bacteroidetes bacterium QS_1_63_11]|nr:MAG: hypothetical protein BRD41_05205 [Bacteroidetes bacterium QS_1_63_11]
MRPLALSIRHSQRPRPMRNFFERQDEARRKATRLVALFALAVGGIIVSTYLALIAVLAWGKGAFDPVQPQLALAVAAAVLVLVGGGSLFKVLALRDGGHVVAESLGGEKLDRDPETPDERRLLNVVEEMAIASGVPVPPVYVLEEEGINAFAAGFTPDDAVIGVTRECVELLDRDELQGVIAHEFSHILNEDMRLNIQSRRRERAAGPPRTGLRPRDHRVCRVFLRSAHQGGRLATARVSGRRVRGTVYPESRRHRRGPKENRRSRSGGEGRGR